MDCPKCKALITHVVKSLPMVDGSVRRRRECFECDHRFTTLENIKEPKIKRDMAHGIVQPTITP
jgi:transcriptional repressor NrdR